MDTDHNPDSDKISVDYPGVDNNDDDKLPPLVKRGYGPDYVDEAEDDKNNKSVFKTFEGHVDAIMDDFNETNEKFSNKYVGGNFHGNDDDSDDLSLDALVDLAKDRKPDAGAIKTENVYHPKTKTPEIQQMMGQ